VGVSSATTSHRTFKLGKISATKKKVDNINKDLCKKNCRNEEYGHLDSNMALQPRRPILFIVTGVRTSKRTGEMLIMAVKLSLLGCTSYLSFNFAHAVTVRLKPNTKHS
jgi:hypothetical protein